MTEIDDRRCGWLHGCVQKDHTTASCYWRYTDECLDLGMSEYLILPQHQWQVQQDQAEGQLSAYRDLITEENP